MKMIGYAVSASAVQRPVDTVRGTGLNPATATNAVWVGGGWCHGFEGKAVPGQRPPRGDRARMSLEPWIMSHDR